MPRPKRWFHVSQDINFDPEFELLCKNFGLGGVRFFLQVMSILDKTDNHWSLHKDFDLNVLARCCGTKPRIILGSYQLLIDMKWISVGVDEEMNMFIFAPNYLKYRGNRVHEKEKVKRVSCMPPSLPLPLKEIHKEKAVGLERKEDLDAFEKFWKSYPCRNGKKFGKLDAQEKFLALTKDDQHLAIKAAQNYSASELVEKGFGIKDPKRFLQKSKNGSEHWREWIEPEIPGSKNSPSTCSKRIEDKGRFKPCGKPATKAIGKNPLCDDCHTAFLKEQKL